MALVSSTFTLMRTMTRAVLAVLLVELVAVLLLPLVERERG
jgi:hypothetical protein